MADYPPNGLAASIKKLPEWIQLGCGDKEYFCKEKNATFLAGSMPDKQPDLSKHNNFFAETMREHPGLYEKLKVMVEFIFYYSGFILFKFRSEKAS